MQVKSDWHASQEKVEGLFEETFSASEGEEEGALIKALVHRILGETPGEDLAVFLAEDDDALIGAILFTPLRYSEDPRRVVLLSPVAVSPNHQGRGVGQSLIRKGLAQMALAVADIAITYGDPAFYSRVGFRPISEGDAPAPHPLQFPEGWLGQSLSKAPFTPLKGTSRAVAAFDDPSYW